MNISFKPCIPITLGKTTHYSMNSSPYNPTTSNPTLPSIRAKEPLPCESLKTPTSTPNPTQLPFTLSELYYGSFSSPDCLSSERVESLLALRNISRFSRLVYQKPFKPSEIPQTEKIFELYSINDL